MKILKINLQNPSKKVIDKVVKVFKEGEVVVYPTDTVYGLGANALDKKAVEKVFKIKEREFNKPISVIVRDWGMMKKIANFDLKTEKVLKKILPGPVTVILYKKKILPDILTAGTKKIGIRIPDCQFTKILMEYLDFPITTTSANISGKPASGDIREILEQFKCLTPGVKHQATPGVKHQPDLVLDAGILPESKPSTVLDLTGSKPKILRAGPITKKELFKILNFS